MTDQADRGGVQQLIELFMCAECLDEHGTNPQSVSCYCDCHSSSRDKARWPSMREAVLAALQGSKASPQPCACLENQRRQLDALGLLGEFAPSVDLADALGEALLRARAVASQRTQEQDHP